MQKKRRETCSASTVTRFVMRLEQGAFAAYLIARSPLCLQGSPSPEAEADPQGATATTQQVSCHRAPKPACIACK